MNDISRVSLQLMLCVSLLYHTATPIDPRCQYEVRRWQHGSYTLVDDAEGEQAEFSLEAKLFSCQNGTYV